MVFFFGQLHLNNLAGWELKMRCLFNGFTFVRLKISEVGCKLKQRKDSKIS